MRVVFFGSPAFALPSLEAVAGQHEVLTVISQPDRPAGRGKKLQPPPVKELALRLGLPVEQPTKLRDGVVTKMLLELRPDVFVVVAYGRILPPDLLAVPRLGPWNVHASLLPKYRGAAPIQWAVIRGESKSGVCVMRMEEGLDTGPVAARREELIRDDDTAGSLAERLAKVGADLLLETLPCIADGKVTPQAQDEVGATLAPLMKKEDGYLDFTAPAPVVSAQSRGVDPWPGATVFLAGEPVKVFNPRAMAGQGIPGQVLGLGPHGLAIACGEGTVAFAEVQMPGRKRLPAAAVLAGHPIPVGTLLAPPPRG
ncbi:MAG TPA: methionyl-tRNA formyltransferase [Polyangia bacterium]